MMHWAKAALVFVVMLVVVLFIVRSFLPEGVKAWFRA